MFEQANAASRNALTDWMIRGGICLAFLLFGADKFPSAPGSPWVDFYAQIGLGQWFRYFTGWVEIVGALLLLAPRTVRAGLALLICAMTGAVLVHVFVMHHPWNAVIPLAFLVGLVAFGLQRRAQIVRPPVAASGAGE